MKPEKKGRVNQLWIAVGLIMAIGAFGLAYYFTNLSVPPPKPVVPSNGTLVVVARISIPSGTLITPDMLELTRIKGILPANAYGTCEAIVGTACSEAPGVAVTQTTSTVPTLEEYAVVPIAANTVITQSLVSPSKVTQTPSFGNLNLPAGDVAIAIPLSSQEAVAGYLQAGDRIDFIAQGTNGNVGFTYQDILVLGIGAPQAAGAASSAGGGLVVLEVTRSEALGIEALEKSGAIYTIALRSAADYGHGYIPTTVTPADNYTQACTPGTKVNPILEEALQQANAAEQAATKAYSAAQNQLNRDNSSLQSAASGSATATVLKEKVLADDATLAQDQFALLQAQDLVNSDEAVLYCGATAANSSSSNGFSQGSPQMLQNLFGLNIG